MKQYFMCKECKETMSIPNNVEIVWGYCAKHLTSPDHSFHSSCSKRPGKCCKCDPHEGGCDWKDKPEGDWEKENPLHISALEEREKIVKMCESMKKEPEFDDCDCQKGFNKALDEVIKILKSK